MIAIDVTKRVVRAALTHLGAQSACGQMAPSVGGASRCTRWSFPV